MCEFVELNNEYKVTNICFTSLSPYSRDEKLAYNKLVQLIVRQYTFDQHRVHLGCGERPLKLHYVHSEVLLSLEIYSEDHLEIVMGKRYEEEVVMKINLKIEDWMKM